MRALLVAAYCITALITYAHPTAISEIKRHDKQKNYRLDQAFTPTAYEIELNVTNEFAEDKTFSGDVLITLNQNEAQATAIRLHKAADIALTQVWLNTESVPLNAITYDNETEIMEIPSARKSVHHIRFAYIGKIYEDMFGLYLGVSEDNNEPYLATHMEPTFARRVFPCFDEPSFKASFKLSVIAPENYHVLSNQPGEKEKSPAKLSKFSFESTPPMSTYLLATVISKFDPITLRDDTELIPMKLWGTKATLANTEFVKLIAPQIIINLGNIFSEGLDEVMAYDAMGFHQLDQVALPDMITGAGAMENWGLVTYRAGVLQWNAANLTLRTKQTVANYIAHEFAHAWFGNWVTLAWWSSTWLNEGFARYYEFHGLGSAGQMDEFELEKQFAVSVLAPIMVMDGFQMAALTSTVNTPGEILDKFDSITYDKGASIIRMLKHMVGDDYQLVLNQYLSKYKNSSVEQDDLFGEFAPIDNIEVTEIMKNWVDESGYPVVTVQLVDEERVGLHQKQFQYTSISPTVKAEAASTKWYIPISHQINNITSKPIKIMTPSNNLTLPIKKNSYFILNPERKAYYRVNYDATLWGRIIDALQSNHTEIDVLTRAQLVDDAFNLARAGQLPYRTAMDLVKYLENETEYYPWMAMNSAFNYLLSILIGDTLRERVTNIIGNLMTTLWKEHHEFLIEEDSKPMDVYMKTMVLETNCKLNNPECIQGAQNVYHAMVEKGIDINPNLRSIVFCTVLRHSSTTDAESLWNALWQQYFDSQRAAEKSVFLRILGCTSDAKLLMNYLNKSLNETVIRKQDALHAFEAVVQETPEGIEVALEFLKDRFAEIIEQYSSLGGNLQAMYAAAMMLRTDEHLAMFKKFIDANSDKFPKEMETANSALDNAKLTIESFRKIKQELGAYFETLDGSAITYTYTSFVLLACILVNRIL